MERNEWPGHDLTWKFITDRGEELRPRRVLPVDLPWLPEDPRTQVILVAASKVKALLSLDLHMGCMERPTFLGLNRDEIVCGKEPLTTSTLRAGLNQLVDTILLLTPPDAFGKTPLHIFGGDAVHQYLRQLMAAIPLWNELFVPAVLTLDAAFLVTVGSFHPRSLYSVLESPFQLPPGRVQYQTVQYGGLPHARPLAQSWASRAVKSSVFSGD